MDGISNGSLKRPACDNCKDRKMKCDRGAPCSSCTAAKLDCRITRRAPEKRQRVLISTRYDEAMENVNRSLQEVSQGLQQLLQNAEQPQRSPNSTTSNPPSTSNHLSSPPGISEGYRGDSSFKAHVHRMTGALRDAAANLEVSMAESDSSTTTSATQIVQEATNSEGIIPGFDISHSAFHTQYPELEGRSLPPIDPVLRLLRLTQTEQQRVFLDIPVLDAQEFGALCQKVFFALSDYSLAAWTIVNAGLYYLFIDLPEYNHDQVGVTNADIETITQLLSSNLEAAIQALRLCQDPSMEGCQALDLLATYCIKSGRHAMGWTLIAAASRMCIDLGWHLLSDELEGPETTKKQVIFWHIYTMDKGMAFTLGRTPSIPQYDVTTGYPSHHAIPGSPSYLYTGFLEFAVILGEMHIQLFSAAAQRGSSQTRVETAKTFAARLIEINANVKQSFEDDPPFNTVYASHTVLLDIIMHCLVTIAYRIVPSDEPTANPLQCNSGCIDAARKALSSIVLVAEGWGKQHATGWKYFLNMLLSLVPFTCFVVLAGNTVATSSAEDLALLSAAVSAIEPIAAGSASGTKLHNVCKSFYELASFSVNRRAPDPPAANATEAVMNNQPAGENFSDQLDHGESSFPYEHIMAPQDWDTVMNDFDLGVGAGAMASFVEPYIPFDGRLS